MSEIETTCPHQDHEVLEHFSLYTIAILDVSRHVLDHICTAKGAPMFFFVRLEPLIALKVVTMLEA